MSCETWKDPMALHAGGNLSPAEATALERHLRGCPACRRYSEEIAASQEALRRFHERSFDEVSLARIRRSVLKRIADDPTPALRRRPRRRSRPAMRWLALAASLILAVSLWLTQDLRKPLDPPEPEETPPPSASLPEPPAEPVPPPSPPAPPATPRTPAPPESDVATPQPHAGRYQRSWTLLELGVSHEPLESSPGLVVLASGEPSPSSPRLVVPPRAATASSPGLVLLDLTVPSSAAPTPVLRRLLERTHYTIYWLEEPADTLKEKEDANTKIL